MERDDAGMLTRLREMTRNQSVACDYRINSPARSNSVCGVVIQLLSRS